MITDISNVKQYAISGTPAATYEIPFAYFTLADIVAYLTLDDGTVELLVIDTNYTLSAVGSTGTLTRVGEWTADCTQITIARLAALIQDVTFTQNTILSALVLETLFDRVVAYIQQVKEEITRTVTIPITDGVANLELPSAATRAGKAMAFDLSGNITVSEYTDAVISTFMKDFIQLTTAKSAQEYLGAVSAATADRVIIRDASGRAKVAAPSAQSDIALLSTVTAHNAVVNAHGAVSAATPDRIMVRDEAGRAKVVAPSAADDIAIKSTVTDHAAVTEAHGAVSAATASTIIIRDASGRARIANPSDAGDITNKGAVETYVATLTDQALKTTSTVTHADITATESEGTRSAGSHVLASTPNIGVSSLSYVKKIEFKVKKKGTYTVYLTVTGVEAHTIYGRIYKNGTAVGTERTVGGDTSASFSENVTSVASGDLIQIYGKGSTDTGGAVAAKLMCNEEGTLNGYGV